MAEAIRIVGLDPGLRTTGYGLIELRGTKLVHVAHGTVTAPTGADLAHRLAALHRGLEAVIAATRPDCAAVEETFVNADAAGALKLGQARAIALVVPALAGLAVAAYAPNLVKKAVVGRGHADKEQVRRMVERLLPGVSIASADAADALAVAICHAHLGQSRIGRLAAGALA